MIPVEQWYAKYGSSTSTLINGVLPEFQPYKPVTGDMEGQWITSRRQHKEFLRRNNLVEVGNEKGYMTRHGGMAPNNPNLMSERQYEDKLCRTIAETLEQLRK